MTSVFSEDTSAEIYDMSHLSETNTASFTIPLPVLPSFFKITGNGNGQSYPYSFKRGMNAGMTYGSKY